MVHFEMEEAPLRNYVLLGEMAIRYYASRPVIFKGIASSFVK